MLSLANGIIDNQTRRVRYLRISVTDRCNYRCSYCMPDSDASGVEFGSRSELLTFEEIEEITRTFAGLGVRKIRLTGGEPTIRVGIVDLVHRLAGVAGIEQVVMTSNGHLLADLARPLADAGLSGIHISVDSLNSEKFQRLTGRGDLARVKAGIAAAAHAGILRGINTVALANENASEIVELCVFAWAHNAVPRFIEHMPMSAGAFYNPDAQLTAGQIRSIISQRFGNLVPAQTTVIDGGPARYWALSDGRQVGVISAMSEHFCGDCNRLRLTSTGQLHACLGYDDAISLRDALRSGQGQAGLHRAIAQSITGKRDGHSFAADGGGGPAKHMISVGG
jgi:GTP 3',8-cyclase